MTNVQQGRFEFEELGGDSPGYLRVLRLPEYHEKRLSEVDRLAKKP